MILVVGGAGVIGSQVVNHFVQTAQVIVYDNLSTGHQEAVDSKAIFIQGDIADEQRLTQVFTLFPIEAVMHFASVNGIAESIRNPQHFYENNVAATLTLLRVMRSCQVKNILFSSAVYQLLQEDRVEHAMNPFEHSVYFIEQVLQDYSQAYGFNSTVLRPFTTSHTEERIHEYTHVEELVNAHILAFETLMQENATFTSTCVKYQ